MSVSRILIIASATMICLPGGLSQDAPHPDVAAYQSFFRIVRQLIRSTLRDILSSATSTCGN
jgi:hypothetical protein